MKRTNLVLDEEVLAEATRLGGQKTYSATVNAALHAAFAAALLALARRQTRGAAFAGVALVVAALFHAGPLLIKSARAALESVPPDYEKAARSLGAGEWRVFWQVSLPLAWNQVLAATALVFARSLGDFGITIMLAGNIPGRTQTLSVAIYDAVEGGRGDVARVLVLVISAIALTLLYLANRLGRSQFGRAL